MTTEELGFNQFMSKDVSGSIQDSLKTLMDSRIGSRQFQSGLEFQDTTQGVPISSILGDIIANSITANTITGTMISSLSISGKSLVADTGTIGGWTLGATSLTAGSAGNTVGLDSGGTNPALYAGSATPGSAPFRVTKTGDLTATSATITGTISGSTITGSTLQTGSGTGENVNITSAYISLRSGASELGWLRSVNGAYGSVELKTDSINFYNGLCYMVGNASGLTISTDSGSKALYLQGQAGIFMGSGNELTVDQAVSAVTVLSTAAFIIPHKAGAYSGANTAGQLAYDTTNHRLYVGEGGTTWKSVLLS